MRDEPHSQRSQPAAPAPRSEPKASPQGPQPGGRDARPEPGKEGQRHKEWRQGPRQQGEVKALERLGLSAGQMAFEILDELTFDDSGIGLWCAALASNSGVTSGRPSSASDSSRQRGVFPLPSPHAGRQLLQKAGETAKLQGKSRFGFEQPKRGEAISWSIGRRCWVVVMVILLNWMACGCAARDPPPFNLRLKAAQMACLDGLDVHAQRAVLLLELVPSRYAQWSRRRAPCVTTRQCSLTFPSRDAA